MGKQKVTLADAISAALAPVSESDTEREQIVYIDLKRIYPDPSNFYSMDGIDELAANIATVGLQQPLRVREDADYPGSYVIVSGHRRHTALEMLDAQGEWGKKVPCIIERGTESAALRELRLIYANSGTRVLSSADTAAQAERVTALLYQLKEEGFEFPGRMRDHVAEACKVSKTKIATLHAIQTRLQEPWLGLWKGGKLTESAAYELSKFSPEQQHLIEVGSKVSGFDGAISAVAVENYRWKLDNLDVLQCFRRDKAPCENHAAKEAHALVTEHWNFTCGKCCGSCPDADKCKDCCPIIREEHRALRAVAEKANAETVVNARIEAWMNGASAPELEKMRKADGADEKDVGALLEKLKAEDGPGVDGDAEDAARAELLEKLWRRFGELLNLRGISAGEFMRTVATDSNYYYRPDYYAEGLDGGGPAKDYEEMPYCELTVDYALELLHGADVLGCSIDEMLCHDTPTRAAPEWETGTPEEKLTAYGLFDCGGTEMAMVAEYWPENGGWHFPHGASIDAGCVKWHRLPEVEA